MDILKQIKLLTNNTNDSLINIYIDKAVVEIEEFTGKNFEEGNKSMMNVLVDIVVIKLNRFGTEGVTAQSYSGASESYIDEYPHYILKQLNSIKYSDKKRWGIV